MYGRVSRYLPYVFYRECSTRTEKISNDKHEYYNYHFVINNYARTLFTRMAVEYMHIAKKIRLWRLSIYLFDSLIAYYWNYYKSIYNAR